MQKQHVHTVLVAFWRTQMNKSSLKVHFTNHSILDSRSRRVNLHFHLRMSNDGKMKKQIEETKNFALETRADDNTNSNLLWMRC